MSLIFRGIRAIAWIASCALVCGACRPGAGARCDKGDARCLDGQRALVCEAGQYIEVPCRGPKGCATGPTSMSCDIAGSRPGDRCSRDEEGSAACADAKSIMACHDGHFSASACLGPKGCALSGDRALCDSTIGVRGEACREEGKKACASDGSAVLECKARALTPLYSCRGPRGCAIVEGKLDCDMSIASEGEACDARLEGHVACNPDHSATVLCKSGHFVLDEKCKRGTTCSAEGNQTHCVKG